MNSWQFLHSARLWADLIGASVRLEAPLPAAPDPQSANGDASGGSSSSTSRRLSGVRREDRRRAALDKATGRSTGDSSTDAALVAETEEEVKRLMDDPRVRHNPLRLLIYPLTEVLLGSIQYSALY